MIVWKSDEKLLIFASLIYPSKIILFEKYYQAFDTVFHHQMKHLEVRQKYSAACRIFNSLLGFLSGDETVRLMLGGSYFIRAAKTTREKPSGKAVGQREACSSKKLLQMSNFFGQKIDNRSGG